MKRYVILAALLFPLVQAPLAASAAQPLDASTSQRQAILDLEFQLNDPGQPAAQAHALQTRVASLQSTIETSDIPTALVPAYGGCDADRSVLAYLQDRLQNGNLDPQSQYTDRRNIHDVSANLKQRGC